MGVTITENVTLKVTTENGKISDVEILLPPEVRVWTSLMEMLLEAGRGKEEA